MKIDWIRHAKTIGTIAVLGVMLALLMWFPDVGGFLAMVSGVAFFALMLYALIYSCFSTDDGDNHGV